MQLGASLGENPAFVYDLIYISSYLLVNNDYALKLKLLPKKI